MVEISPDTANPTIYIKRSFSGKFSSKLILRENRQNRITKRSWGKNEILADIPNLHGISVIACRA